MPNCALNARAWLEIDRNDSFAAPYVLDATFNVVPQGQNEYQPELAQATRAAFLSSHLAKAEGGDVDALDNNVSEPKAACCKLI